MLMTNNPYRAFEEVVDCWRLAGKISGEFDSDFRRIVSWCVQNNRIERYHRRNFGMSVEPYGIDLPESMALDTKIDMMVDHAMAVVDPAKVHWEWLYGKMSDWDSKVLLLTVLAYRCIGWRYVKMPLDTQAFWSCMAYLDGEEKDGAPLPEAFQQHVPYPMKLFDLSGDSNEFKIYSNAFGVFNEFVYSQYILRARSGVIGPQKGDVVMDCGACYGGTSLKFAEAVGEDGLVVAYEFLPSNVAVFNENMKLNPILSGRVKLLERPVWHKSGVAMSIEGSGPATQVFVEEESHVVPQGTQKFESITIDQTVKNLGLPRVDFIKMDIEGAEMMALRGARKTIERDLPNLAICVYHKLIDFYEIPQFIDSLGLGYVFHLQHSTVHGDETVVFATVDERQRSISKSKISSGIRWIDRKRRKIMRHQ